MAKKEIFSENTFWELIDNFETVEKLTPYGRRSIKHYVLEMQSKIEDLEAEVEHLQQEYRKLEQDLQDNYQPLPRSAYTGDSDDDRY